MNICFNLLQHTSITVYVFLNTYYTDCLKLFKEEKTKTMFLSSFELVADFVISRSKINFWSQGASRFWSQHLVFWFRNFFSCSFSSFVQFLLILTALLLPKLLKLTQARLKLQFRYIYVDCKIGIRKNNLIILYYKNLQINF